MKRKKSGYITVSETVDVDVWVDDVLEEATDEQLRKELFRRNIAAKETTAEEAMREWRDALERGDSPLDVAASIRAFMFYKLPPIFIAAAKGESNGR